MRGEAATAEARGPEGRQYRVGGTGNAVLIDPGTRDEHAADHVGRRSRRGAAELVVAEPAEPAQVRHQTTDLILAREQEHVVAP